jgi:hypothetical protein
VHYCTTLKFAASLLRQDCHELLAKHKRELEWALFAYENHGRDVVTDAARPGCNNLAEPYGSLVLHIVNYDAEHGHTPNLQQLCDYVRRVVHDPQQFGKDNTENMDNISVLEQYVEDNAKPENEREWPVPADAEALVSEFVGRARWMRFEGMCKDAIWLAHGDKKVYDRKLKAERRSTHNDAIGRLRQLIEFDLTPAGGAAAPPIPEIPPEAAYGWLGRKAIESGMPLGFIYPALLGVFAGKPIRCGKVHPSLYVALLGDVETGKSQAIERAQAVLGMKEPVVVRRSASSDRGLFKLFGDDPKQKDVPKKSGGTFVMCLTELRHMFTKMAMENNSLPPALSALWDSGKDFGTADKFNNVGCAVTLSIVGGLKCKDPDEFSAVFGADTMHGLYSRFVFGSTSEKWEYKPEDIVPERRDPCEIAVTAEAWSRLAAWRKEKPGRSRLAEIAMRIAVISEAAEKGSDWLSDEALQEADVLSCLDVGQPEESRLRMQVASWKPRQAELSAEALEAALRFMEWQEALREAYTPSEAIDDDARCTEAILKAAEELGSFKWNTVCKNKHWCRKFGARRVAGCRTALATAGQITYDKETGWVSKC